MYLYNFFKTLYFCVWFQIKYQADPDGGFRILEGSTLGMQPKDTVAVKKAKEEHAALFKMIAKRNQQPAGELALIRISTEKKADISDEWLNGVFSYFS